VVMKLSAKNEPKLLKRCPLPLTGAGVVDVVITDLGAFTIGKKGGGGMTLAELAPGVTPAEIKENRSRLHGRQRAFRARHRAAPAFIDCVQGPPVVA